MKKKIGYLGPEGTYTDQASYLYSQTDIRIPYGTIKDVTKSIENGDIDECILPIENSLHGTVIEVSDYLIASKKNQINVNNFGFVNVADTNHGSVPSTRDHLYSHVYKEGTAKRGGNEVSSLVTKSLKHIHWLDKVQNGPRKELVLCFDNSMGT